MNRLLLGALVIHIFFCIKLNGQQNVPVGIDTTVFCLTPTTKHRVVNGVAFGLTAHPWSTWEDTTFMQITGLNLEVGPLGIIGGLWGTLSGLIGVKGDDGKRVSFFTHSTDLETETYYPKYGTHVRGLSISLGGISDSYNYGVFINGLSGYCYKMTGVQVSGLINNTDELNGVSIALLANLATEAKGLQIGLINNCTTGNVLQIGLFNRIGKRVTPFVNFRFKSEPARGHRTHEKHERR